MSQLLIFITTFIIQFIIAIEMNMIGPLAPFLSKYFDIKDSTVILFNLGYSAVGILVPFLGILSDRYGKKKILSFSLLLFLGGSVLAGFANTAIQFAFGRIFIGLGYYSLSGTNLSYISEFIDYSNRGKASGILRIAFGIAILFSPIYSTSLVEKFNNISAVYLPLTALALLAYILLFTLPETKKSKDNKFDKEGFIQLLTDPKSKKIFASIFFITTAPCILLNFLGIYLTNEFSISQVEVGFAYTIVAIGTLLGIFVAAAFTDKVGKMRLAKILFVIMVLSQVPIPYLNSMIPILFFCLIFAFGLDGGWTAYQTFATEIQSERRGTFMSLFYMCNALTVTFYSLVGSVLYSMGGFKLVSTIAVIFSAIGLVLVNQLSKMESN